MSFIKKLTINNHEQVLKLFGSEKENYYFLIDDLKRNKYDGENFKVFGEYEDGELKSILLNNNNNITYFSSLDININVYKEIMDDLNFKKMSGDKKFVEKFEPLIQVKEKVESYLGVMRKKVIDDNSKYKIGIINTREEIGMQYDLLISTKEYQGGVIGDRTEYIDNQYEWLQEGNDRRVYLMTENKMVSSSSTFNEGENSAVIIGVVTHPNYRGRGYGSKVLRSLFNSLIEEEKYPYLFYNNPVARDVYRKLGVDEICEWMILYTE